MQATAAGRYAPSPTGLLHLGNLRTALAAWASARKQGLRFLLRIEDIDAARCRAACEKQQLEDLALLGITWDDTPIRQSDRIDIYTGYFDRLVVDGSVYPCFCSRKDVAEALSAPHASAGGAYPGTCARLNSCEVEKKIKEGRQHCWRLRVQDAPKVFRDEFSGDHAIDLELDGGDFVIRRADGLYSYQFVCAVDDALTCVTEVVRADDLLDSGLRQSFILSRLKLPVPKYYHIPLMHAEGGKRLAKREGSDDLRAFVSKGFDATAIRSYLAFTLGQCNRGERIAADELAARWDWGRVPRVPSIFSEDDLKTFAP